MNRSESWQRLSTLGLFTVVVAFAACGEAPDDAPRPQPRPPVVQADAAPLPDFHRYVVGALDEPQAADRDPFTELRGPKTAASPRATRPQARPPIRFSLRGIVERDGRRVALFARGSVGEGERLAGWTVVRIDERSVVLRRGTREQRLSL